MPFVTHRGQRIHYTVTGEGPLVVLQHGLFDSAESWARAGYVATLSQRYQVACVNSLGHGLSDKPADPTLYAQAQRAGDVGAVIDALGAEREDLRRRAEQEILDYSDLHQNNCLINAICRVVHNRNADLGELLAIRFNLGGIGQMMVASQASINAIRNVLGINNPINVYYPANTPTLDEPFDGVGDAIDIYHTGEEHFVHNRPRGIQYR